MATNNRLSHSPADGARPAPLLLPVAAEALAPLIEAVVGTRCAAPGRPAGAAGQAGLHRGGGRQVTPA